MSAVEVVNSNTTTLILWYTYYNCILGISEIFQIIEKLGIFGSYVRVNLWGSSGSLDLESYVRTRIMYVYVPYHRKQTIDHCHCASRVPPVKKPRPPGESYSKTVAY